MQGELRLYNATNGSLTDWNFVNVIYATNHTTGRVAHNDNTWASVMRDCPTCPMHSVSNMFECPDFFPIGPDDKWMFCDVKDDKWMFCDVKDHAGQTLGHRWPASLGRVPTLDNASNVILLRNSTIIVY